MIKNILSGRTIVDAVPYEELYAPLPPLDIVSDIYQAQSTMSNIKKMRKIAPKPINVPLADRPPTVIDAEMPVTYTALPSNGRKAPVSVRYNPKFDKSDKTEVAPPARTNELDDMVTKLKPLVEAARGDNADMLQYLYSELLVLQRLGKRRELTMEEKNHLEYIRSKIEETMPKMLNMKDSAVLLGREASVKKNIKLGMEFTDADFEARNLATQIANMVPAIKEEAAAHKENVDNVAESIRSNQEKSKDLQKQRDAIAFDAGGYERVDLDDNEKNAVYMINAQLRGVDKRLDKLAEKEAMLEEQRLILEERGNMILSMQDRLKELQERKGKLARTIGRREERIRRGEPSIAESEGSIAEEYFAEEAEGKEEEGDDEEAEEEEGAEELNDQIQDALQAVEKKSQAGSDVAGKQIQKAESIRSGDVAGSASAGSLIAAIGPLKPEHKAPGLRKFKSYLQNANKVMHTKIGDILQAAGDHDYIVINLKQQQKRDPHYMSVSELQEFMGYLADYVEMLTGKAEKYNPGFKGITRDRTINNLEPILRKIPINQIN